jgi:hypothetical protein
MECTPLPPLLVIQYTAVRHLSVASIPQMVNSNLVGAGQAMRSLRIMHSKYTI